MKKTDGNHYAEGYDKKNPQHQSRVGHWQV
jgi:hypothetical protein